jgi:hypothetical protein
MSVLAFLGTGIGRLVVGSAIALAVLAGVLPKATMTAPVASGSR